MPTLAKAQYQKSVLQLQTDSLLRDLRHRGIDTICVYQDYCVGCVGYYIHNDSPCRSKGILIPTYFFWLQAGRSYALKVDNCSISATKEASQAAMWAYFFEFSKKIQKEKIKKFVTTDHGSVFSFTFYTRADTVEQYFEGINLLKAIKHPKRKNQYYHHNIKTHTAQLQKLLRNATTLFPQP